jgi:hypothetical protein
MAFLVRQYKEGRRFGRKRHDHSATHIFPIALILNHTRHLDTSALSHLSPQTLRHKRQESFYYTLYPHYTSSLLPLLSLLCTYTLDASPLSSASQRSLFSRVSCVTTSHTLLSSLHLRSGRHLYPRSNTFSKAFSRVSQRQEEDLG